eukprot:SAG31_NODE_13972_length_834_cov_0.823129_1_plen_93_part_00
MYILRHGCQIADNVVIDVGMLNKIASSMIAFIFTVVPIILSLNPHIAVEEEFGVSGCGMSEVHKSMVHEIFTTINASCTFNLTVGPSGVTLH